ncbi:MAG: SEC-C metal-binding domain-containing protein [archaeon]|nr:SEC-C metal-binding domain-containing protein [archaeon]
MVEEYSDEELEEICDRVYEWGVEFSESKYFEELTEEQKQESEFVVMSFTEYMYSHHGLSPEEWDEDGLEECCLYTLPRKITADESYYRSIAPVLSAFFAFVGEKNLLKKTSQLTRKVKEIDKQIVRNASDPRNWGIAKSFAMAAKEAGVDITNEKEMQKFIARYNLQQLATLKRDESKTGSTPKSRKSKIGRNDPCPCGSGKKYKRCCGR